MAAAEASKEIKIAGFRPGKAPRKLVEQKVGQEPILNQAAEKAIQKAYVDFIVKEKLEVLGSPEVVIDEIKEGADLKFKARVAVMPEVKIGDGYRKGIKEVNKEYAKKSPVAADEDIKLELDKLANSRAKLVTVRREAKNGDAVEIDFNIERGGVPIENGSGKNHPLVIGKGVFVSGFEENIVGMKEGEQKEVELKFPDDYHQKDLAGKPANFKIKLNLVQERQIPEINDEFAKSLGQFADLEALKKNIHEGLEHENKHKISEQKRNEYLDKIIAEMEIELPEILISEEIKKMLGEFEYQIQAMGMDLEGYLGKIGKKKEDLEKDWRPQAEKRVKSALALKEIAKQEEIKVESKKIEEEMNKTLTYYKNIKDMEKNINLERLYNYTKGLLENEAVFERLEKL